MAAREEATVRRRGRCRRPQGLDLRQPPRSPAREREQSLYVLSRGDHHSLRVYSPEPPEPEAPHPVPLLGLTKHGLHPNLAFAQRLLVGCGPSLEVCHRPSRRTSSWPTGAPGRGQARGRAHLPTWPPVRTTGRDSKTALALPCLRLPYEDLQEHGRVRGGFAHRPIGLFPENSISLHTDFRDCRNRFGLAATSTPTFSTGCGVLRSSLLQEPGMIRVAFAAVHPSSSKRTEEQKGETCCPRN